MQRRKNMDYIIVAFRSREHTLKFYNYLKQRGVPCAIVNTPKQAGVGCGLSVKIPTSAFAMVKNMLYGNRPSSFAGYFAVSERASGRVVRSI